MSKFIDLTGQRFGRLKVIEKCGVAKSGHALWLCECDCGNYHTTTSNQLHSGTESCGCLQRERASEAAKQRAGQSCSKKYEIGHEYYRLHQCYKDMLNRCFKTNSKSYARYGGRGITVCEEWKNDFYTFRDWALLSGYTDLLTLDRIDVNGNYEPNNCRWVTIKIQNNNRSNNRIVTYNGETMTLHELSEKYGIAYKTLWGRVNSGWSISTAVETPIRRSVNGHYIKTLSARFT
jgi:hypothetical protein